MVTKEMINEANALIKPVPVKGKDYALVASRIAAFRSICPSGAICTEIVNITEESVTMRTTVADETGKILATGYAKEDKDASYINKTSYIENCETSAVGRALGMLGIGSEQNIASAEELVNALNQQELDKRKIDDIKIKVLEQDIANNLISKENMLDYFEVKKLADVTEKQFSDYVQARNKKQAAKK